MFLALRTLLRTAGFERAAPIGRLLGDLQFHLSWRQRRRMQQEMAAALGRPNDAAVGSLLREAHRTNNAAVLQIMSLLDGRLDDTQIEASCQIDGLDHLREVMARGRGAVLLATHMGNAVLPVLKLAQAGWPVSVVYREARMMSAGFFQAGLERYGIEGILANTGIQAYAQMVKALKQGRIVFMMLDQGVKQAENGVLHRFLAKDMAMPAGPAQLARVARAPVLPMATVAAEPRWRFSIEPAVVLEGPAFEDDLARLVSITERQVLAHPELWSWHQRRWRRHRLPADQP